MIRLKTFILNFLQSLSSKSKTRGIGWIVLTLLVFSLNPLALEAAGKNDKVTINLPQNLVLKEFIKIISMRTNTVFVYQEQILRGQMSITAPPNFQVTAEDAFFFFEKILKTQGLAMVKRQGSNVVEIVPAAAVSYTHLTLPTICSV